MKRSFLGMLSIAVVLLYVGCSEENSVISEPSQSEQVAATLAKKPAPSLTFSTHLGFLGGSPTWEGTATLEDGSTYGMRFFNLSGPPRDFSQAKPFEEYWEIYDLGDPDHIYLAGTHSGVLVITNSQYVANGKVELADGPFELWLGRTTHMSGVVYWLPIGMPDYGAGELRVN